LLAERLKVAHQTGALRAISILTEDCIIKRIKLLHVRALIPLPGHELGIAA
jgi:hypothetical protein